MSHTARPALIPLGHIATCQYGLSEPSDPNGERLYIGMGQLQNGRVVPSGANRITVSKEVATRYELSVGDVLFNRTNSLHLVGKTGIVRDNAVVGSVFASYLVRLKVIPDRYDSRFLNLWLNTRDSIHRLRRLATPGVSQYNIRPSLLAERFLVPAWPLSEQRIVADVDELFAKLSGALEAQVRAKRSFKRGLTLHLLTGQKRFPEFKRRVWVHERLGNLVEAVSRRNTGGVTLVLSASGEHGLVDQRSYFNRSVVGEDVSRYYLLKRGEFAYNRSAMLVYPFGATKRLDRHSKGALSTLYLCFAIRDARADSDYLVHVFESGVLNRQLRRIVRVGARAHGLLNVTASEYFDVKVPFPEVDEQCRIAGVLNECGREIDLLERMRQQVELEKRALLCSLLSGEISMQA